MGQQKLPRFRFALRHRAKIFSCFVLVVMVLLPARPLPRRFRI